MKLRKSSSTFAFKIMRQAFNYALQPKTWITALLGVGAMESFYRLAPRIGLAKVDNATPSGTYFLPPGKKATLLGYLIFYSGAVVNVSLFRSLEPKIKGSTVAKSLMYGTALYLLSSLGVMPLTGMTNPYMRRGALKKPGLFGSNLDGWKTPVSNLIGHLIYSQVIGYRKLHKKDKKIF
jgi:uncharacterized membrane protein YagU involved in acid resistance